MSQTSDLFGSVNSSTFGAPKPNPSSSKPTTTTTTSSFTTPFTVPPVSEKKGLFANPNVKFSTPFSTSNSIPNESIPNSSFTFSRQFNPTTTTPTTTTNTTTTNTTTGSIFGKPTPIQTGFNLNSNQTHQLQKISPTEFFESREFGKKIRLSFDPSQLAQWLEKHCHSFTNDSSLKLLVEMATVQTDSDSNESPQTSDSSQSTTTEPSPSSSTINPESESRKSKTELKTSLDRFNKITLTQPVSFSRTVWEHALSVLIKDTKYTMEMIKEARLITEYQIGLRFQELMRTASNTPRFIKGVKQFSLQIGEVLDEVFGKLCKVLEEEERLLN
ncbi:hypothetical protein DFH28DRAFT_1001053 [Melampsora americana]|nr:hypothetical protein DFH28DRAFT_1001053 [Melampsora americana]